MNVRKYHALKMSSHLGTGEMLLPFSCDVIWVSMFQFQEQLGQGCSPEESDTFQAQGWCETTSKCFLWPPVCFMFRCCVPEGSEILDQMLQCLEHLPKPMPQLEVFHLNIVVECCPTVLHQKSHCPMFLQDYLDMVGLSAMFPRVEVFLIQGSPVDMLERPPMDGRRSRWSG